jgi:hypothetical protein
MSTSKTEKAKAEIKDSADKAREAAARGRQAIKDMGAALRVGGSK